MTCGGSGVKSFPKPLSAKEENVLLEQMRAGVEAKKAKEQIDFLQSALKNMQK